MSGACRVARLGAIISALAMVFAAAWNPVARADSEPVIPPDSQASKAVAAWENPSVTSNGGQQSTLGRAEERPMGSQTRTAKNYRGSFLMWAEECVEFSYNGRRVNWSSGWQTSGAVFPNNVTRHGTTRISSSSALHSWRGKYTVGAGVPTPWGNVNVYNATSTVRTDVRGSGAWSSWWVN